MAMVSEVPEYFQQFKQAFFRRDLERFAAVTTDDFVWEQHHGADDELPNGRTFVGAEATLAEAQRRAETWSGVRYNNVEEQFTGEMVVQTFDVSGTDSRGQTFHVRAVDLYPVRDGKVVAKRTFWKQVSPGPAA